MVIIGAVLGILVATVVVIILIVLWRNGFLKRSEFSVILILSYPEEIESYRLKL